jgi:integrase
MIFRGTKLENVENVRKLSTRTHNWYSSPSPIRFRVLALWTLRSVKISSPVGEHHAKRKPFKTSRKRGPDVWEFRWREPGPDGKRKQRRMVVGSVLEFRTMEAALDAVQALLQAADNVNLRAKTQPIRLRSLIQHYSRKELADNNDWKSHATKISTKGYIKKWILPRWGKYLLAAIKASEVELWLGHVPRSQGTRAKLRNIMSGLYVHAMRHGFYERNPISLVRQSAKRKTVPEVLTIAEIHALLDALPLREWVLVVLALGTGLRLSELFALKWGDINFETLEMGITRSIVMQVVGRCKTESSQKPIPLDAYLAAVLTVWRAHTPYDEPQHWVFASPKVKGAKPYWGQSIMRKFIRPAALKAGIKKRIGWHTFRHTYTTLLSANQTDPKVMQELLRHGSVRVTLDLYAQAVTPRKRKAQSAVVRQLRRELKV